MRAVIKTMMTPLMLLLFTTTVFAHAGVEINLHSYIDDGKIRIVAELETALFDDSFEDSGGLIPEIFKSLDESRKNGLKRESILTCLIGFNLGVEFAQISLVAVAMSLTCWISKQEHFRRYVTIPGSIVIAVFGAHFAIERLM